MQKNNRNSTYLLKKIHEKLNSRKSIFENLFHCPKISIGPHHTDLLFIGPPAGSKVADGRPIGSAQFDWHCEFGTFLYYAICNVGYATLPDTNSTKISSDHFLISKIFRKDIADTVAKDSRAGTLRLWDAKDVLSYIVYRPETLMR